MAIKLEHGDYCIRPGGAVTLQGADRTFADTVFRLQCVRGSFPFLPGLGSRLWQLGMARPSDRPALARQYCAEALEGCGVEAAAVCVREEGRALLVEAELSSGGNRTDVEVNL